MDSKGETPVSRPPAGRKASRDAVLATLHVFDRAHPIRLTRDAWEIPEIQLFDRAIQALARDLQERDGENTAKQRDHANGRVLRSADAAAAAGARLAAKMPWLAAKLYRLAFIDRRASYRALRRDAGLDQSRDALTTLRWALYRGVRAERRNSTNRRARAA